MLFNFPHFHFHFFFGPSFCGRKELTAFPANSSVTIYLPASCSFLFALSDTFHYGRGSLGILCSSFLYTYKNEKLK